MTIIEKKQKLEAIKDELSRGLMSDGFVRNIDNVFFRQYDAGCVLRDLVYYGSIRHGLDFEVLSLDAWYFVGSYEHAKLLQCTFGGSIGRTEYCSVAENPRELWYWDKPVPVEYLSKHGTNVHPLSFEDAFNALFMVV